MKTYDELSKDRKIISKLLSKESGGEINDFDFIVNFLSHPVEVTFIFGVQDKSSFEIEKYKKFLEMLLSSLGYPNKLFRRAEYVII